MRTEQHADETPERVADYLDGRLPAAEATRFEQDLAEPSLAQALAEELALREWLATLPPDEVPEDVLRRLERTVGAAGRAAARAERAGRAGLRGAIAGFAWAVRGPAAAGAGSSETLAGLSTLRYTLGPLGQPGFGRGSEAAPAPTPARPSLWGRLLRRAARRPRPERPAATRTRVLGRFWRRAARQVVGRAVA